MKLRLFSIIFFCLFTPLAAEMQNHYILGSNGIDSAVKPDCGEDYTALFTHYYATRLNNQEGDKIDLFGNKESLKINYLQNILSYFSPYGYCGILLGCQLNIRLATPTGDFVVFNDSFDLEGGRMQLSDLYVEPINLRYHTSQLYLYGSYGFIAPTGRYTPFSPKNTGLGNWGQMLNFAFTYFFDDCQTFSFSAFINYEFHSKKRHIDLTPGDNLCVDWGLGKTFCDYYTLGLAGYYEQQITHDNGKDLPAGFHHTLDRVFAVGPEIDISIPKLNGALTFRYEIEFSARSRPQGQTLVAEAIAFF